MSAQLAELGKRPRVHFAAALVLSLLPVIQPSSFSGVASALTDSDCSAASVTGSRKVLYDFRSKVSEGAQVRCVAALPSTSTKAIRASLKSRAQQICATIGNFPGTTARVSVMGKPNRTKSTQRFDRIDLTLIP